MHITLFKDDDVRSIVYQQFLKYAMLARTNGWQAIDLKDKHYNGLWDLHGVSLEFFMLPHSWVDLSHWLSPDTPWAEDHFLERVSGEAQNPQQSELSWPYGDGENKQFKEGEHHSHTYSERFWPNDVSKTGSKVFGIRYEYGDLNDVIATLIGDPTSRQAVLPIWYPEDTAKNGVRKPCSLFYHFMVFNGKLELYYSIRSCDLYRHFINDIYFAIRLQQYVLSKLEFAGIKVKMGRFKMDIGSLHLFEADLHNMPATLHSGLRAKKNA